MESSWPYDGGAGANLSETQWQKMARRWLPTGVVDAYLNKLAVSASGAAMSVSVATGGGWVEGFYYENDSALAVPIAAANATNPRIDLIVLRNDRTANQIRLAVVQGVPAAAPVAPALSQTDVLWELVLAEVRVDAAVGVIAAGKVTDRRTLVKPLTEAAANAAYEAKPTELFVPAVNFIAGDGAPSLGRVNAWPVWLLDAATLESVVGTIGRGEIPPSWATYSVELLWVNTAASAGNVAWQIGTAAPRGEGDTVNVDGSSVATAAAGGLGVIVRTPIGGAQTAPPTTDPIGFLRILRDAANGADTLANDVGILGVRLLKVS